MRFICQIHPFSCARICAIRLKVYFLYAKRKQSKWNIVQVNSEQTVWWKVTMKMHNYPHPQCDCIENGFDFCHFPMYVECCTWACDMLAQGANTLTKCLLNRAMLVSFQITPNLSEQSSCISDALIEMENFHPNEKYKYSKHRVPDKCNANDDTKRMAK